MFQMISKPNGQRFSKLDTRKRKTNRQTVDACVIAIENKIYPVENWSMGGVMFFGDEKKFALNQHIEFTMKFKLRDRILEVKHDGHVSRKGHNRIAIKFTKVSREARGKMREVLNDRIANDLGSVA